MSAVLSLPIVVAVRRAGKAPYWTGQAAALASVVFGVYYIAHQA